MSVAIAVALTLRPAPLWAGLFGSGTSGSGPRLPIPRGRLDRSVYNSTMRSTPERDGTFTERARRGQIVECAIELIAERGYGDTSIAKIAERAGIAKSVVLYHFVSKEELVGAVVTQVSGVAATA